MHLAPSLLVASAFFIVAVRGHGKITNFPTRQPGGASLTSCGQAFNDHFEGDTNMNDLEGPIYPSVKAQDGSVVTLPSTCNWYFCRGMEFADNSANVQEFAAGSNVHFDILIQAAHEGMANISVVKTSDYSIVANVKSWASGYGALKTHGDPPYAPADQVNFDVTFPDLSGACSQPGDCVVQWWWWGSQSARDQYFESCVDFTQGGSSNGSTAATASASPQTAAISSAVAVSSGFATSVRSSIAPAATANDSMPVLAGLAIGPANATESPDADSSSTANVTLPSPITSPSGSSHNRTHRFHHNGSHFPAHNGSSHSFPPATEANNTTGSDQERSVGDDVRKARRHQKRRTDSGAH